MQNHGKSVFDLDANLVAMLCYVANFVCYLGLILSIITIIQDKTNKLARFHAFQSIFLMIAGIVIAIPLYIVFFAGVFVDAAIGLPLISGIIGLAFVAYIIALIYFVIMAAIKGYNGEIYKIPVVGNFADKYSN
jgi:uncharacterized membrane protein